MQDSPEYSAAQRIGAALGLVILGAFGFILLDVLAGGRLTGRPCTDCDQEGGDSQ